jgi:hypothetical protein
MKIMIPIEIEIVEIEEPNGDILYQCKWGNFLDNKYLQLGCAGYNMAWIVENVATRLADALTPTRLTYEITKRLGESND